MGYVCFGEIFIGLRPGLSGSILNDRTSVFSYFSRHLAFLAGQTLNRFRGNWKSWRATKMSRQNKKNGAKVAFAENNRQHRESPTVLNDDVRKTRERDGCGRVDRAFHARCVPNARSASYKKWLATLALVIPSRMECPVRRLRGL